MTVPTIDEAPPAGAATITKDFVVAATPETVWSALRDFGALATRLAPGFITDCQLEGRARIVTFSNGSVSREELLGWDDASRRIVYAIEGSQQLLWHRASAQVFAAEGGARFVWVTEVLPAAFADYISGQMDLGVAAMAKAMTD
jgi:carbon monoxide dehydrogenase subunit G